MSSWECSALRALELGKCHWPLQAASSGSIIKAPGFAGGYLLASPVDPAELLFDQECGGLYRIAPGRLRIYGS
jgi:hypothetical protein